MSYVVICIAAMSVYVTLINFNTGIFLNRPLMMKLLVSGDYV